MTATSGGGGDSLDHSGVRGMKWGVRRERSGISIGPARSKREVRVRNDRHKAVQNRRHLSDEEIKKRIDRLQNEKKLKELTKEDLNPGKSAVSKILSESGHQVAKKVAVGAASVAIGAMVAKKFNSKPGLKPEDKVAFNVAKELLPHLRPKK